MTSREMKEEAKYNYAFSFYSTLFEKNIISKDELKEVEEFLRDRYRPICFKTVI